MPHIDHIIESARELLASEGAIPLDVAASLMAFGIDVETLERKWREELGL